MKQLYCGIQYASSFTSDSAAGFIPIYVLINIQTESK